MPTPRAAAAADTLAIGLSTACLAHCLALPLVASLLPLFGAWAEAEWTHWLFVGLAAPLALWALTRSRPMSRTAIVLAPVGLIFLVLGAAGVPSHEMETTMTVAGGLILASAHLANWRRRNAAHRCA